MIFKKFIWCNKREVNDLSLLNADTYDKNRRKAIKFKVEKNMRVNSKQLEIFEYYLTQKGGLIACIKLEPRVVTEIHRRAAKAANVHLRSVTFVPKLARDCKTAIDKLLMEYKRQNNNFRYIVRNAASDIKVLVKRFSEGQY